MDNKFGLRDEDLAVIRRAVQSHPAITKVILFGSRALGTHRPGSDVDLALVCSERGDDVLRELSVFLNQESTLPYKFDLVLYSDALDASFKEHIDRYGKLLQS